MPLEMLFILPDWRYICRHESPLTMLGHVAFVEFGNSFQNGRLHHLLRNQGKAEWPAVASSSFLHFSRTRETLAFFLTWEVSPGGHHLSKINETLAKTVWDIQWDCMRHTWDIQDCISPGPMYLCTSNLFRFSLIWSCSTTEFVSNYLTICLVLFVRFRKISIFNTFYDCFWTSQYLSKGLSVIVR